MQPIAISINDAARALGIGRTLLYKNISNNQLEVVKVGRRTLVKVASLEALVQGEAK
jgi:excisionase family DNA binding protein